MKKKIVLVLVMSTLNGASSQGLEWEDVPPVCVGSDTFVAMSDGSKKLISEVKIGDVIMTHKGIATVNDISIKEVNVLASSKSKIYRVTNSNGDSVTLTFHHPICTKSKFIKTQDANIGDNVALLSGGKCSNHANSGYRL